LGILATHYFLPLLLMAILVPSWSDLFTASGKPLSSIDASELVKPFSDQGKLPDSDYWARQYSESTQADSQWARQSSVSSDGSMEEVVQSKEAVDPMADLDFLLEAVKKQEELKALLEAVKKQEELDAMLEAVKKQAQSSFQEQGSSQEQEDINARLERANAPTSVAAFPGGSCWKVTAGTLPVSSTQGPSPPVEVGGTIKLLGPEALPCDVQNGPVRECLASPRSRRLFLPGPSRGVLVNGYRYGFLVPEEVDDILYRGQAVVQPCC
jgi:hypothetical protein